MNEPRKNKRDKKVENFYRKLNKKGCHRARHAGFKFMQVWLQKDENGTEDVGKTSLLVRYADNKYTDKTTPTIGVDYRPVYGRFKGHFTKLMIWDTAGQEKFKSITMSFYHGTHAVVVVYDVTRKDTLHQLPNWISDIRKICGDIPIVIIGNKHDSKPKDCIQMEEISTFIDEMGFSDKHFLASALTGENVAEAFAKLTNTLMENDKYFCLGEDRKTSLIPPKKSRSCYC